MSDALDNGTFWAFGSRMSTLKRIACRFACDIPGYGTLLLSSFCMLLGTAAGTFD